MKIFVIGGSTVPTQDPGYHDEMQMLIPMMQSLGRGIATRNHDLLVCSPFPDSADRAAAEGAATAGTERLAPFVHFFLPESPSVTNAMAELKSCVPGLKTQEFLSPCSSRDLSASKARSHAWLLAQLCALDQCHAVIAIGGRQQGAMHLLLSLAETRRKFIIPLCYLGGAAEHCFERQRHRLRDQLGSQLSVLNNSSKIESVIQVLEEFVAGDTATQRKGSLEKFFISYPRSQPEEADFVEAILRRRSLEVFRDEHDFSMGRLLQGQIDGFLYDADVFIALWCKEYACSPWCFDELDMALKRQETSGLEVWILCLDDTRIVPPKARGLIGYRADSRNEIEGILLKLLQKALS